MNTVDLLCAFDCVPEEYVLEAGTDQALTCKTTAAYRADAQPQPKEVIEMSKNTEKSKMKNPIRFLLIAALIASLGITAFAAVMRNLNWSAELQETLKPYNEISSVGAASKNWQIEDAAIELSIKQPENSELKISCSEWSGKATGTLETGTEYWLEKWNGTDYQEIPTLDGNPWTVSAQSVKCGSTATWTADYSKSYGQLEPGNYRLGMMVAKAGADMEEAGVGCFAKFQIYPSDMKSHVDTYFKAFTKLINADHFHVRVKEYIGNHPMDQNDYMVLEVWKAGDNFLEKFTRKTLEDAYVFDSGKLLKDGVGYALEWGDDSVSPTPAEVEKVDYLNIRYAAMWDNNFGYAHLNVSEAYVEGNEIVLIEEADNNVINSRRETRITYDAEGNITHLRFDSIDQNYYQELEVVPSTLAENQAMIDSIIVEAP